MSTTAPAPVLTGVRWSTAVRCSRAAAYQAIGIEGEPYPESVERMFARGARIGRVMADEVVSTLAAQGRVAIPEREVPWPAADPIGIGHADIDIPADDTVVEVFSTAGGALDRVKVLQVTGYAINLGRSQAKVLAVDPSSGEETVYPVNVEGNRPVVERIEAEVVAAKVDGVIPDRLNGDTAHPGVFMCQTCPFRRTCYDGWTPPPAGRAPGHADDFERLLSIEREAKRVKKLGAELEEERNEIRERLAGLLEDRTEYIEGGVQIKRTPVAGRRTMAFSDLEAAGYSLPPEVEAFVSTGKGYDRWTIKELSDGR